MIPSFHSPHLLWLLVPLVLLFSWELARHTTRAAANWPKIARAWAGSFHVSLGTQHTTAETRPRIWLWFGLACCIVALARPQWGTVEEQVFDQAREVIIAVDLSKSMLSQDVKPSRLDRSKLLITSLLDGLKGERVGLVLFAGTAFLQSPLSADYEVLREFLPALNPGYLPEGGSDYKAMLETSIQAFGTSAADRYLIVLNDGESTDDDWKSLIESLKNKGIRVIGLGVGTPQGSFIPDSSGGFIKDDRGAVVLSRLNSSTLEELAQTTGGAYADASSWIDLSGLLKQTVEAGKKGDFSEKNTARKIERYQWFLAPGLLLLFISFWAEFPVRPRERPLPLGGKGRKPDVGGRKSDPAAATLATLVLVGFLAAPKFARAAEASESPGETLAKPLSTTVARLSVKDELAPKDCAELAQTTITFGQRLKSSQQQAPEGVIRDGLAAVDLGEKQDAKAADWPKLRHDLEELLKKPEDEQKKDQQKQDKNSQQQQQQNQQNQNQDQQQNQKDQENQQQQQQSQQSDQQKQEQQQQKQNQSAFGDMKDQQEKKGEEQKPPQQPPNGTQKVGGQSTKKQEMPVDPELTVPLQKLDQVRNQDSPAKLQQIMQGQQKQPAKKGKDW
ncbi:MAG TPA: VWA domain-containing protein [Candidatus Didemnitutus sp.]|nr:VWA domain-containing protein [Candidatus Didemnitutus sp.]